MVDNGKRTFGTIQRWRIALRLARIHEFSDDYWGSRWHDWERRIKAGNSAEEKRLAQSLSNISSADPYFDDFIAEDYGNIRELTNNMYAALIVSIWSEMEYFLKSLVRTCYTARGEHKPLPFRIEDIKKVIEKETGIQIGKCKGYITVDAIRILNNSYKHSNGNYRPDAGKPHTQISKSLMKKWKIEEGRKIEYSKLPIEKIYISFTVFCADVLKKVASKLELVYGS